MEARARTCTRTDFWRLTETDLLRCQKTMSTCRIQFKMCVRVRCVNADQVCEVCARTGSFSFTCWLQLSGGHVRILTADTEAHINSSSTALILILIQTRPHRIQICAFSFKITKVRLSEKTLTQQRGEAPTQILPALHANQCGMFSGSYLRRLQVPERKPSVHFRPLIRVRF